MENPDFEENNLYSSSLRAIGKWKKMYYIIFLIDNKNNGNKILFLVSMINKLLTNR